MCHEIPLPVLPGWPREGHAGRSRQVGMGLPAAIFLLVVLAMLAVAMGDLLTLSSQASTLQVNAQRAVFAAHSGVQAAAARLLPAGQPATTCGSVPGSLQFAVDGLRGCEVRLQCREDRVASDMVFTVEAEATCGTGPDEAVQVLRWRLPYQNGP